MTDWREKAKSESEDRTPNGGEHDGTLQFRNQGTDGAHSSNYPDSVLSCWCNIVTHPIETLSGFGVHER